MEHSVRLSDLGALAPADYDEALSRLMATASAPINGQATLIKARIATFETRYEITSAELVSRLARHEVEETAEYVEWLFWLKLQELSVGR